MPILFGPHCIKVTQNIKVPTQKLMRSVLKFLKWAKKYQWVIEVKSRSRCATLYRWPSLKLFIAVWIYIELWTMVHEINSQQFSQSINSSYSEKNKDSPDLKFYLVSELKTLEWWISRSILDPLDLRNPWLG